MSTMAPQPNGLRALFEAALDIEDPRARAEYLAHACAGTPDKLRQINELLQAEQRGGGFLNDAGATRSDPFAQATGQRVGRYKLLQQIGEGGCGIVYMAEQEEPVRRKVALKIIKAGMDTKSVVARFEAERQALALMDHPNIAKFFDAGTAAPSLPKSEGSQTPTPTDAFLASPRPYFVMELVRGIRITEYCDQHHLDATARLQLFIQVCHAIQHAHQKGIIHRDLKPSNILVTVNDGVPVPKIIDFGIAKATEQRLTDRTLFTAFEQFLGTPAYMSPEQAAMTSLDIDTRSDIYSLGVLLYELLTSRTPFEHKDLLKRGIDELRKTLREIDPPRPSTRLSTLADADQTTIAKSRGTDLPSLLSAVRGDLDWIVMKCLEKDRTRRYDTATGLARDIERFLANEPVSARPPSRLYLTQKFVRRNQAACAATATIGVALVAALFYSSFAYNRERSARTDADTARVAEAGQRRLAEAEFQRAERNANDARANVIRQYVANGSAAANKGNVIEALPWFAAALQLETDPRRVEMHQLRLATSLRSAPKLTHRFHHNDAILATTFSPDLRSIATASRDRTARVWDLDRQQAATPPLPHPDEVQSVAFSKDNRRLLTRTAKRESGGVTTVDRGTGSVHLWDIASAQPLWERRFSNIVSSVFFTPDESAILVACSDNHAYLLRTADGALVRAFPHPREVRFASISPDGKLIATNSRDQRLRLWDAGSGRLLHTVDLDGDLGWNWEEPCGSSFSQDSQRLLAFNRNTAGIYEVATGKRLHDVGSHYGAAIQSASFNSGDTEVLTATREATVQVFNAVDGKLTTTIRVLDHFSNVQNDFRARFTPDGRTILAWNLRGPALYDLNGIRAPVFLGTDQVLDAQASADGRRIALATHDGNLWIWDVISEYAGAPAPSTEHVHTRSCITPDGKTLIVGDGLGQIGFWDTTTGRPLLDEFPSHPTSRAGIQWLDLHPQGHQVVTRSMNGLARVWDTRTGQPATPLLKHPSTNAENGVIAVFTPRGDQVISGDAEGVVRLWSVPEGRLLRETKVHPGAISAIACNPKAKAVVVVGNDQRASLWDPSTLLPTGHSIALDSTGGRTALSPDGQHLIVGVWTVGNVHLFRLPDGTRLHTFPNHGEMNFGQFSADGTRFAAGYRDGYIRVWELSSRRLLHVIPFSGAPSLTGYSPDGRLIATAGSSGLTLVDAETGEFAAPNFVTDITERYINGFAFTSDGRTLFAGGGYGRIFDISRLQYSPEEWFLLATALSRHTVTAAGRLEPIDAQTASDRLTAAQRRFHEHFSVPDAQLARWQWQKSRYAAFSENWARLASTLDRLIMQGQADRETRLRRAIARFHLGDLRGAAEDHPDFIIPTRDPKATSRQIDLTPHYNRLLTRHGLGSATVNLHELPTGLHSLEGIPFDLRGVVWLASSVPEGRSPHRPQKVPGIQIKQKAAKLHMLQASEYSGDSDGMAIGHYTIHYTDGTTAELPIVVGQDTADWWKVARQPDTIPNATVAWTGNTPMAAERGVSLRLWKRTYVNPRPDLEIASLDFVAAMKVPAPFLVAITTE